MDTNGIDALVAYLKGSKITAYECHLSDEDQNDLPTIRKEIIDLYYDIDIDPFFTLITGNKEDTIFGFMESFYMSGYETCYVLPDNDQYPSVIKFTRDDAQKIMGLGKTPEWLSKYNKLFG